MYYLQSRYYDPQLGRFINADEAFFTVIGETALCCNLMSYCENDAAMGYDPTGSYDRDKAVKYAKKWYKRRNKEYYSYSSDCANFVSQCLYAGGLQMNDGWYSYKNFNLRKHLWNPLSVVSRKFWYDWTISESWRLAQKQFAFFANPSNNYMNSEIITIKSAKEIVKVVWKYWIQKGDLLYFAKKNGNEVYHATMIAKVSDGRIYYTAHSKSRWEYNLTKSMGSNQVFIVRIKNNAR